MLRLDPPGDLDQLRNCCEGAAKRGIAASRACLAGSRHGQDGAGAEVARRQGCEAAVGHGGCVAHEHRAGIAGQRWRPPGRTSPVRRGARPARLRTYTRAVGKHRLARTPFVNHSWRATLHLNARGLTASLVPNRPGGVEIALDLGPMTVAEFHARLVDLLRHLGATPELQARSNEVLDPVPFVGSREAALRAFPERTCRGVDLGRWGGESLEGRLGEPRQPRPPLGRAVLNGTEAKGNHRGGHEKLQRDLPHRAGGGAAAPRAWMAPRRRSPTRARARA